MAILLSAAAVLLHILSTTSSQALWRDEANTAGLATLPGLRDVWSHLQFDSFPLAWPLFVRGFLSVAGEMNDGAVRGAGFAVGLLALGALWFAARSFGHRLPLVSLALFALSPSVIRWGDSFRGYGFGITAGICVLATVWTYVNRPGRASFATATFFAIVSVHIIFYNATVVLAACAGAAMVCIAHRSWRRIVGVASIGMAAAVSLLPYRSTIASASEWNSLVQIPNYSANWFFIKLGETLDPAGLWTLPLWIGSALLALIAAGRESISPDRLRLSQKERDVLAYAATAIVVGAGANIAFLNALSYVTQPWYYLTLLAITAVGIDAIAGVLIKGPRARALLLGAVAAVAIATFAAGAKALRVRMTNADLVARIVSDSATSSDLIVVSPWYAVVSFARYYSGAARWMTIPPVEFHRFHRYDLLREPMGAADQRAPAQPVLNAVERTLRAGGTVFVVGGLARRSETLLQPARIPEDGWKSPQYQAQWEGMVRAMIETHSRPKGIPVPTDYPVSLYETMHIAAARGWIE